MRSKMSFKKQLKEFTKANLLYLYKKGHQIIN